MLGILLALSPVQWAVLVAQGAGWAAGDCGGYWALPGRLGLRVLRGRLGRKGLR